MSDEWLPDVLEVAATPVQLGQLQLQHVRTFCSLVYRASYTVTICPYLNSGHFVRDPDADSHIHTCY
jgi:hypothetical protein